MGRLIQVIVLLIIGACSSFAQTAKNSSGKYQVLLHRQDGNDIVFNFLITDSSGSRQLYIVNGDERIPTEKLEQRNDSLFFQMQVFESSFRAHIDDNGIIHGMWIVQLAQGAREMPFTAYPADYRFKTEINSQRAPISGRWAATFSRLDTNRTRPAVASGEMTVPAMSWKRVNGSRLD